MVIGSIIAALYAGLTFMSNFFGIAYGPVQFRFSEALTVLPVFTPAAIPGLCVGCFLSNIASFNPIDMVFGTVGTLCAAFLSYYLRNVKFFKLPVLSAISPVIINSVVVGAEIAVFLAPGNTSSLLTAFTVSALWVAIGEAVTCVGLGLLLYTVISKNEKALKFVSRY